MSQLRMHRTGSITVTLPDPDAPAPIGAAHTSAASSFGSAPVAAAVSPVDPWRSALQREVRALREKNRTLAYHKQRAEQAHAQQDERLQALQSENARLLVEVESLHMDKARVEALQAQVSELANLRASHEHLVSEKVSLEANLAAEARRNVELEQRIVVVRREAVAAARPHTITDDDDDTSVRRGTYFGTYSTAEMKRRKAAEDFARGEFGGRARYRKARDHVAAAAAEEPRPTSSHTGNGGRGERKLLRAKVSTLQRQLAASKDACATLRNALRTLQKDSADAKSQCAVLGQDLQRANSEIKRLRRVGRGRHASTAGFGRHAGHTNKTVSHTNKSRRHTTANNTQTHDQKADTSIRRGTYFGTYSADQLGTATITTTANNANNADNDNNNNDNNTSQEVNFDLGPWKDVDTTDHNNPAGAPVPVTDDHTISPQEYRSEVLRQVLALVVPQDERKSSNRGGGGGSSSGGKRSGGADDGDGDDQEAAWCWSERLAVLIGLDPSGPVLSAEDTTSAVLDWWKRIREMDAAEWMAANGGAAVPKAAKQARRVALEAAVASSAPPLEDTPPFEAVTPSRSSPGDQHPSPTSAFLWASRERSERLARLRSRGLDDTQGLGAVVRPPGLVSTAANLEKEAAAAAVAPSQHLPPPRPTPRHVAQARPRQSSTSTSTRTSSSSSSSSSSTSTSTSLPEDSVRPQIRRPNWVVRVVKEEPPNEETRHVDVLQSPGSPAASAVAAAAAAPLPEPEEERHVDADTLATAAAATGAAEALAAAPTVALPTAAGAVTTAPAVDTSKDVSRLVDGVNLPATPSAGTVPSSAQAPRSLLFPTPEASASTPRLISELEAVMSSGTEELGSFSIDAEIAMARKVVVARQASMKEAADAATRAVRAPLPTVESSASPAAADAPEKDQVVAAAAATAPAKAAVGKAGGSPQDGAGLQGAAVATGESAAAEVGMDGEAAAVGRADPELDRDLAAECAMLEELVLAAEAAAAEKGQLLTYSKTLEQHIDQLEVLALK